MATPVTSCLLYLQRQRLDYVYKPAVSHSKPHPALFQACYFSLQFPPSSSCISFHPPACRSGSTSSPARSARVHPFVWPCSSPPSSLQHQHGASAHMAARAAAWSYRGSRWGNCSARTHSSPCQGGSSGATRNSSGNPIRWPEELRPEARYH